MSVTIDNVNNDINGEKMKDYINFDIRGTPETGLDKSVVNALRRTILSDIPCVAFRVERERSDIVVELNKSSLHNEFILDRIALIPLSINPETYYKNEYLFKLNIKNEPTNPIKQVTSNNFTIYKIKDAIKGRDIDIRELDNYDILSDGDKDTILNPFEYTYKDKTTKEYCIVTELRSNNVSGDLYGDEEINLYGTPSVSTAKENAAWMTVSNSTSVFKIDDARLKAVIAEQTKIHKDFSEEEFRINESERYYHLDARMQPYYYNFSIEKVGYYDAKTIFIKGCEILLKRIQDFNNQFDLLNTPECRIKIYESETIKGGQTLMVDGENDTLGSIVQAHIVKNYIEVERDDSPIMFCGYKRVHPLEERIMFTIKMKSEELKMILVLFKNVCIELEAIIGEILKESQAKLK
jgi:DNA-directed RNA polymerase subunit L